MYCVLYVNDNDNDVLNLDIYRDGFPIDAASYVDYDYAVYSELPKRIVDEVLIKLPESGVGDSIRINFEGEGDPDMAQVGLLLQLLIANEISIMANPW